MSCSSYGSVAVTTATVGATAAAAAWPYGTPAAPAAQPATYLKISESQANALRALKAIKSADKNGYRDARRALFSNIREQLGIPADVVLSIEIDDRANPLYCVAKARPPKSKSVAYVPMLAGPDGKFVGNATPAPAVQWSSLPLRDVVALLQEQGETMEGYKAVGALPAQVDPSWQRIPPAGGDDGVEMYVTPDEQVIFRQATA